MSEINRVFVHIDGFFAAGGGDRCMALANVIAKCVVKARRAYYERDMEDKELVERIKNTLAKIKSTGTLPPKTDAEQRQVFRDLAVEAMTLRRAVLPLRHPSKHWVTLDPAKALFDDDDQYSFAIYDTLADEVGVLLPDLHKIAVEVAWDADRLD